MVVYRSAYCIRDMAQKRGQRAPAAAIQLLEMSGADLVQLPSDLPILLITGDDDRVVPTADTIRLAEALPQATLVVIPNCGHVPQEECPAAFVEAVEKIGVHSR